MNMQDPQSVESSPSAVPGESPAARADRNFVELLQGLRVAVTGVQVLFAFLLTVPFSPGFEEVTHFQRDLYYVALVSAAVASIFFIAPAAQHRILFRQGLKEPLVHRSNRYAMVGTLALAVSITSATLLVVDYIFHWPVAVITSAVLALLAVWIWFVGPFLYRSRQG
ncbi:DUF6328 family protein [Actinocorallia aurantiaca]|uniref:DUF6328 family protein n=2 Tax=Actinocorallia aurantiaca TaxID=46204 RepID=A0ABN3U4H4_9ACTN